MAVISRGQITIVDLNDGKSINLYLGSNVATTQIFNKENSSYVPSWSVSPFLAITPEVYVTGVGTNQVSRLKGTPTWKINGSTTLSTFGATAATTSPYALTIKNNMTAVNQLQVECEVIYVDPDTSAETKAKALHHLHQDDQCRATDLCDCLRPGRNSFQKRSIPHTESPL